MAWAWLLPALWLGLALASTVHELGHALAARAGGARVVAIRIGRGSGSVGGSWRGLAWRVHLLFPVGGACQTQGPLRPSLALLERAAGSLANLLVAGGLLAAWPLLAGPLGWSLMVAQLALGLGQLLPVGSLDGAVLWRLLRERPGGAQPPTSSTSTS